MSSLKGRRAADVTAALTPHFRAALKADDTLELCVYEEIGENFWTGGGVTAASVKQALEQAGDDYDRVSVRINSPGGDAFEGIAIRSLLRSQPKPVDVYIDGVAASAASIIAMAGDTITMASGSMMMIHDAWSMCAGNATDMRKMADTLEAVSGSIAQVYTDRTSMPLDDVKALMTAESWMGAEECMKNGFATAVSKHQDKAAQALGLKFKNLVDAKNLRDAAAAITSIQQGGEKEPMRNDSKAKTKRVDGEDLTWADFIVALDHNDTSTWHLPWKFSTVEKTKAHLRDALARFNQVEGLSSEQKHEAYTKLVHLCKKYGIHVSEKDYQRFTVWALKNADEEELGDDDGETMCECSCENCGMGNCQDCTMQNCMDAECKAAGCPMQDDDEDGDGEGDPEDDDDMECATAIQPAAESATPAVQAEVPAAAVPAAAEESNLSQYEARLRLLKA